jgi:hypothetical protein
LNPEENSIKDYLVKSMVKLAKYDKNTAMQLFHSSNELESEDQSNLLLQDIKRLKEYGFTDHELSQLSSLVDRARLSKNSSNFGSLDS